MAILLLPGGEGRDEGERSTRPFFVSSFFISPSSFFYPLLA
jgi:hypothetical protein